MRAGVWPVCVMVVVLGIAVQGCNYKLVPRADYERYLALEELNNKQAGIIAELRPKVENLEKVRENLQNTVDAQLMVMKSYQGALDKMKGYQEYLAQMRRDVGDIPGVTARDTARGPVLELEGDVLFDSGRHTLKPSGKELLDKVAARLKDRSEMIIISGHTDPDPIRHSPYQNNMHLSAMRALSVWEYLASKGIPPHRMSIAGYGDSELIKKSDGTVDKARSRRAEILVVAAAPTVVGPAKPEPKPEPKPAPKAAPKSDTVIPK